MLVKKIRITKYNKLTLLIVKHYTALQLNQGLRKLKHRTVRQTWNKI